MSVSPAELPLQPMLGSQPLQLVRIRDFKHDHTSYLPHRHNFLMLLWVTAGKGMHAIDFNEFEMYPGLAFFLEKGQVHCMKEYPEDGWMILFDDMLFNDPENKRQLNFTDQLSMLPYIEVDQHTGNALNTLVGFLAHQLSLPSINHELVRQQLYLMLLYLEACQPQGADTRNESGDLVTIRKLKSSIKLHYKEKREISFYSQLLGTNAKKLNQVAKQATGKTVYQLITERLLTESKALLTLTNLTIRQITFELNFDDTSNFGKWFKKQAGLSPQDFRYLQRR